MFRLFSKIRDISSCVNSAYMDKSFTSVRGDLMNNSMGLLWRQRFCTWAMDYRSPLPPILRRSSFSLRCSIFSPNNVLRQRQFTFLSSSTCCFRHLQALPCLLHFLGAAQCLLQNAFATAPMRDRVHHRYAKKGRVTLSPSREALNNVIPTHISHGVPDVSR